MDEAHQVVEARREFLGKAMSLTAMVALANTGIYAVGMLSKHLDGSMVAGAKCTGYCSAGYRYECADGSGCHSPASVSAACAAKGGQGQRYGCDLNVWVPY